MQITSISEAKAQLSALIESVLAGEDLPPIHRDRFDRTLIAQAVGEGFSTVTRDPSIPAYGVATVEA